MKKHQMLIGGEWVDPAGGEWIESVNPFTAAPWALIPRGGKEDVDRAVGPPRRRSMATPGAGSRRQRAALCFAGLAIWSRPRRTGSRRSKPPTTASCSPRCATQLNYLPQWFHYFGGLADKIEGRVIPIDKPGVFNFTREEPLGVVAAITPWNSPLLLAAWKLAPALAAGNTVVWKPSEYSSVSALAFGELFEKAGFPPGVVNIVTGYGNEVGEPLITHPDVAKVAFTGGDRTGEYVYQLAARGIKHVTLELGGKSANIVFDDADLDQAVNGVVSGIFAATGQTCIAGSRALIHRPIHDAFVERLLALAKTARMGNPLDLVDSGRPDHDAAAVREGPRLHPHRERGRRRVPPRRQAGRAAGVRLRLVRRADDIHRRAAGHAHRQRRGLRSRAFHHSLRRRRRSRADRERHRLRPCRRRLDERASAARS